MGIIMRLPAKANRYISKKSNAHKICSSRLLENPMRKNPLIVVTFAITILEIHIVLAAGR